MVMFRKAMATFLVFFLMWGNSGFCLNVHYCATSETFSVMVNHAVGERCGEDEEHAAVADNAESFESCCKKLEQTLPSFKKDCCSDTELEMKITDAFRITSHQLDIQKQFASIYIPLADCFCHYAAIPVYKLSEGELLPNDVPDILSGQDILIRHCVYRI